MHRGAQVERGGQRIYGGKKVNAQGCGDPQQPGDVAIKGESDDNKGIQLIHEAMELAPQNPTILGSLGSAYATSGDRENAAKYLEAALALVPDDMVFIKELKAVYKSLGTHDKVKTLEKREDIIREASP